MDHRIYVANGRSGGKVMRPGDSPGSAIDMDQRDLRVDFETFLPEGISGRSQFGHAFDAWGHRFLSWNTIHIRQEILSPSDLERNPGLTRTETNAAISDHGDSARIYALVPPPRTFNNEPTDHFNASCGLTIERGGIFPAEFAGDAFVCEPLVGLVHRDRLEPGRGPAYTARRGEDGKEFLASTDPWFHPVNLRSGPDGALYVADFYREMVEHPDYVPRELRAGIDFARGKGHGRIYRIVPEGIRLLPVEDLGSLPLASLVEHLKSPNGEARDTAQRVLLERADPGAVALLSRLLVEAKESTARAHSLWSLHALKALEPKDLEKALEASDARLRETALRVARGKKEYLARLASRIEALADDPDPGARFQALLALGDLEPKLATLARIAGRDGGDRWFQSALLSAITGREAALLALLVTGAGAGTASRAKTGSREWEELLREVAILAGASAEGESLRAANELLSSLLAQGARDRALLLASGLVKGAALRGRGSRGRVAGSGVVETARQAAGEPGVEKSVRLNAIAVLAEDSFDLAGPTLKSLLDPGGDLDLAVAAVAALSAQGAEDVLPLLLSAWARATPRLRGAILDAFLKRPARLDALLAALERGSLSATDLDPTSRDGLLRALDPERKKRLQGMLPGGTVPGKEGDRASVLARYLESLPAAGEALNGAKLYEANCAGCHRFSGLGHAVGPELAGIGKKSREELLVALLDPNRTIVPGYSAYTVVTDDGQVLTGVIVSETANAITLRRSGGIEDGVLRASIRAISSTGTSLMPEGLEKSLNVREMADLLEYLRGRSR
jgi:putative heme-binding domain-containing protein